MERLDLRLPRGWRELNQDQLHYAYRLLASGHFQITEIKMLCVLRFAGMKFISRDKTGNLLVGMGRWRATVYEIPALDMAVWMRELEWIEEFSPVPVRFICVGRQRAVSADLSDITFREYIVLDNLYQGYLQTHDRDLLVRMSHILYDQKYSTRLWNQNIYTFMIFYWFASFKIWAASRWSHFFVKATAGTRPYLPTERQIRESVDAQLRVLTKGDITKESEILDMPCHRALTELDALADESEKLKKLK